MKQSLLDMVQEILSDLNSDNVNSISDTIEAQQVAMIIKRTYLNMMSDRVWPHTGSLFKLTPSSNSARPTHMKMEDDVAEILWVKYNVFSLGKEDSYGDVTYLRPEMFIDYSMARNPTHANVTSVMDIHGTPLFINTDSHPTYFTTFDDEWLVFDSYDSQVDSTLQASKTQVFGYKQPVFTVADEFVPDVPNKAWAYFMAEAKAACFLKIKEVFSATDANTAAKQRAWLSREKRRVDPGTRYPDYSKKSSHSGRGKYRNNHFLG